MTRPRTVSRPVPVLTLLIVCSLAAAVASAQNPLARQLQAQDAASAALAEPDALRVFVCGSSSPLGANPAREQACVAVLAGGRLFLVDVGDGANTNLQLGGLPMERLHTVFLTHFHSDHIASIPDVNLGSWVAGREQPLVVAGPEGVATVVEGLNLAYSLDRKYRVAHHGEELIAPRNGVLSARTLTPGVVFDEGGVRVTAFPVEHPPIEPAFGYRFDFGGRSVVISGDTNKTQSLIDAAKGVDVLLHDAMALGVVKMLQTAREQSGGDRLAKVLADIQTYHAPTTDIAELAQAAGVRQLVLYHLVPGVDNPMITGQFLEGMPEGTVLASDGLLFELPVGSKEISSRQLFER